MLSIIIVNYHRLDLLQDCIRSLYTHPSTFDFEIIVADNGSNVGDDTALLHEFTDVRWLALGYNAGFARANNAAMAIAEGNAFLLLNPDTLAVDTSIADCYNRLLESNYAAAGVQLLNENRQPQISGSHFVKGGLNHLLPIPYYGDVVRWLAYRFNARVPGVEEVKAIEEVDWISGAFLMVKRTAVEKAELMDGDFFLYAEEVEWCSRLRKVGKLCLYGDLKIIHLEGATIDNAGERKETGYTNLYDKKGLQLMVSNHVRVRKQYGRFWFLILLINYTIGSVVFFVAATLHDLIHFKNPTSQWKRAAAFANNVMAVWKLAPAILRNRPHFYKVL